MTHLRHVEEALAGLTETELYALKLASDETPQVAPSLLAWIQGACDWELSRRCGFDYRLQPPEAAHDPSEDKVRVEAAYAIGASFAAATSRQARLHSSTPA